MNRIKKGRPGILDDPEKVKQLRTIIVAYDKSHNPHNKIRVNAIYEYVKNHYKEEFDLSLSWWKTTGKSLIEEYERKVRNKTLVIREGKTLDIVDIMAIIERYGGGNKEKLRNELAPVENHILQFTNEIENLQNKVNKLEEDREKKRTELEGLENENKRLKNFAISLFTYGRKSDTAILNMLQLGESKSEVVNLSLKKAFSDPMEFIKELQVFVDKNGKSSEDKFKQNVVPFQSKNNTNSSEIENTLEDDEYDF